MNKIKTGITKTQFFPFISNERFEVCTTFCFSIATTSNERGDKFGINIWGICFVSNHSYFNKDIKVQNEPSF